MTLGKMIRSIRDDLGFTQGEMAAALSISDGYMSQLESGKRVAELRYKDDVYWGIARIGSRGAPKPCWDLYVALAGLDLEWRDPMIYELLGRHFYQRFQEEEKQFAAQKDRRIAKRARHRRMRPFRHAVNY